MSEDTPPDETAVAASSSTTPLAAAFRITFTPERAGRRRIRYEPRRDADGWWRVHEEWTGCTWRITGREPVVDVVVEREVDDG